MVDYFQDLTIFSQIWMNKLWTVKMNAQMMVALIST